MVTQISGPCQPWDPLWGSCTIPTASPCATGDAVAMATEVMWQATGQQFGLCTITIRPCRKECSTGWMGYRWYDAWPRSWYADIVSGWIPLTCGTCRTGCSCKQLSEALLPAPVYDVTEVKLDGQVMDPGGYRVDDNRFLVRVDGGLWPVCQDMTQPDTAVGTWSVTCRVGEDVPVLGRQAVGELACEMLKACAGEDCLLPANVTSLIRQGVSVQYPPHTAQELAERGYFGGLFIQTYNPQRLRGRAVVYDVDAPRFRRTGT